MSESHRQLTLRDEVDGPDRRHLCAYLDGDENLHIDGQDLGPKSALVSGDGEYEWRRTIRAADLPRLLDLLGAAPGSDVLDVLEQSWCGAKAGELERVIRESGIESHLATWSG